MSGSFRLTDFWWILPNEWTQTWGLRAITDFEYELQMSQTNHKLSPNVETMFLTTSIEYSYLSSTTVREIAAFGGDVTQFVPQAVAVELEKKMKEKGECN